jgi:hypothetical protein
MQNKLPEELQREIESAAKKAATIAEWGEYDSGPASSARMAMSSRIDPIQKEFYIKGATEDELKERCEKMEAALRELVELKRMSDETPLSPDYLKRKPLAWGAANDALASGKEVEKPEPTISKCGSCGSEGVNLYLGNQLYLCDGCFEHYENSRDQPTQ